jgi:hypothetical protein
MQGFDENTDEQIRPIIAQFIQKMGWEPKVRQFLESGYDTIRPDWQRGNPMAYELVKKVWPLLAGAVSQPLLGSDLQSFVMGTFGGPKAKSPSKLYRGEGKNIGWSLIPEGQWWSEAKGMAEQYGDVITTEVLPNAKQLRLRSQPTEPTGQYGNLLDSGYKELQRISNKYNIKFNMKEAKEISGEELLSDKFLLDAIKKEGYDLIHTDSIEGASTLVLNKNILKRTSPYTSEDIPLNEWITRK